MGREEKKVKKKRTHAKGDVGRVKKLVSIKS